MIQKTSKDSYNNLDVNRTKIVRDMILTMLYTYPKGLTDTELSSFFTKKGELLKPRVRRFELMKKGLVYSDRKRRCSISNKVALVWKVKRDIDRYIY